jgi:hypothetical protein
VIYGFSVLSIFNSILSTLDYFINSMPSYNPSFILDLGLNLFVAFTGLFVIVYGYVLSFEVKNNVCILMQIPLTLALPLACKFFDNENVIFVVFLICLMLLGSVNSLQLGSVYAQAGCFPNDKQLSALSFGMGLSGILMNIIRIGIIYVGQKSSSVDNDDGSSSN